MLSFVLLEYLRFADIAFLRFHTSLVSSGRFTMDVSGRFVPVGVAESCKYSHALAQDDYRGMHFPANAPKELAPFTHTARMRRAPDAKSKHAVWSDDLGESPLYAGDQMDPPLSGVGLSASGKARATRAGGKLCSATVIAAPSRKVTPIRR